MSDEQETPEIVEETVEDEAPKKGGKLTSIVMIVLGLGLGTGAGMFFVGPKFFGGPSEVAAEATDDGHGEDERSDDGHGAPDEGSGDGHGGEGEAGGEGTVHTIANMIVNPAGSNGSRFLLVDLAVSLSSPDAVTELETRDAAVRDEILLLFGSKTVQELADVSNRAALKEEIKSVISGLLTTGSAREIFFPRFVIQ